MPGATLGLGAALALAFTRPGLRPRAGGARRTAASAKVRCCSSVVEHSLGKGEVESSILSCSTIYLNKNNGLQN